jgi:hypothetical protein
VRLQYDGTFGYRGDLSQLHPMLEPQFKHL